MPKTMTFENPHEAIQELFDLISTLKVQLEAAAAFNDTLLRYLVDNEIVDRSLLNVRVQDMIKTFREDHTAPNGINLIADVLERDYVESDEGTPFKPRRN